MNLFKQQNFEPYSLPAYCFRYCDQTCIQSSLSTQFMISSTLTILTLIVSIYHICMHLGNFNNPFLQSKIIVIMIMAPFYCVTSMGSFIFPKMEAYFTLTRDFYQAVLLFTFFYLIFSYLAYDRDRDLMEDKKVYVIMIEHQKQVPHFFPFNYCQKPYQLTHWKKAKYFTYRCKKYVLQFLVFKVFSTFILYIVYPNIYSEAGSSTSYYIVSWILGWGVVISASYSLYYLVLFYHALRHPLSPYSPLLKFLTVKITLFFTFWQKIMIGIFQQQFLSCFDHNATNFQHREIISSLQNTLICFQMFLMSIAGGLAYSYENYVSRVATNKGSFIQVIRDTIRTFKKDSRLIKPKKFGFDTSVQLQQTQLKQINQATRMSVKGQKKIQQDIKKCYIKEYF